MRSPSNTMKMFGSHLSADPNLPSWKSAYLRLFGTPKIGLRLRAVHLKKNLGKKVYKRILDAGCGAGVYSYWLAQKHPSSKVLALDTDVSRIRRNKKIGDTICIQPGQTFNLVYVLIDLDRLEFERLEAIKN